MKPYLIIVGILSMLVATIFTYSNHFQNDFHFDDAHSVVDNTYIRNINNLGLFFTDGTTSSVLPQNQAYRPLVVSSLAIDYWLANGYNPFWFHLSTFILFLIMGVLLYFLNRKIFRMAYRSENIVVNAVAIFAGAWYLLHPANAETINYIIARSDVHSAFFVVLGFILYLYSPFCKRTFLYLLPVVVGALAKPLAIMFAPMLLCYVILFEKDMAFGDIFKKRNFPHLLSALKQAMVPFLACIALYLTIDRMTPKTWEPGGVSALQYLITQPFVILHYFVTFFAPLHLSADTDWTLLTSVWDARFFTGVTFIITMIWIAFYTSRDLKTRPISFGIVWFFLALIPTSSIIPLGEVLNDHRMFFPFVGLVISVSWTLFLLAEKIYVKQESRGTSVVLGIAAACLLLSGYAYGTRQRNKVWRTEESLWYDVTLKSPANGRGLMNYGLAKMSGGDLVEAEKQFEKALKFTPDYSYLWINLGIVRDLKGDKQSAESDFKKGITLGPAYPDTHFFFGRFLFNNSRYPEAEPELLKTIELSPSHLPARNLLMSLYETTESWDKLKALALQTLGLLPGNKEAAMFLSAAENKQSKLDLTLQEIKKNPSAEKYLDLSLSYYRAAQYSKCVEAANEALRLRPGYAAAFNNIGSAYNLMGKYTQAVVALKKALSLDPGSELARNNLTLAENNLKAASGDISQVASSPEDYINLSLAYFNKGQYEKCIEACYKALEIRPNYDLAYNNICASYNQLKQWDKAIEVGTRGLKINPSNQLLKNNLQISIRGKRDRK